MSIVFCSKFQYKRKTIQASYGKEKLGEALAALENGMCLKRAAREFQISGRTLRRHFKKEVCTPGEAKLGRFHSTFTVEYETEICDHMLDMERRFFGLTPQDVRKLAFQLAKANNIENNFDVSRGMAGKKWLNLFMSRHPELALRKPEATSMNRAIAFNQAQVSRFFFSTSSSDRRDA